jgi:hypothetical protein
MLRRTATALVVTGALTLGGAALLAPQTASATPDQVTNQVADQAADQSAHAQGRHRLLTPAQRRELRTTGHLTVTRHTRKHGTVTVLVQRGEITALSPTSISLRSKDGYSHTYVVTDRTKVREQGQPAGYDDLKVGEQAMVVALHSAKGDVARRIGCVRAAGSTSS